MALVCALLVVFAGVVQVAHTHPGQCGTHADCSLCVAAHLTVQMAQSPAPAPPVQVIAVFEAAPVRSAASALSTFALFTRPPPTSDSAA